MRTPSKVERDIEKQLLVRCTHSSGDKNTKLRERSEKSTETLDPVPKDSPGKAVEGSG